MSLFRSITEVKQYISVLASAGIDSIQPDIKWAEEQFIIPAIGKAQYDALHTYYHTLDSGSSTNAAKDSLIAKIQMPLINFAYSKAVAILQLQISDSAIKTVSNDKEKTAFQWQIEDLKQEYCLEKAFDGMDALIHFMELNRADYPLWKNSDYYTITKAYFINSTSEFHSLYPINKSARTFKALQPVMKKVEDFYIEPILSTAYFDELKVEIAVEHEGSGSATETDNEYVRRKFINPAVAHITAGRGMLELSMQLTADGLIEKSFLVNQGNASERKVAAEQLIKKSQAAITDGQAYLSKLITYLNSLASDTRFETYYNSSVYTNPDDDASPEQFKNDDSPSFLF